MNKKEQNLEAELETAYAHWNDLYQDGGHDSFWEDGCNLNLTRNRIISLRKEMEKEGELPEICHREISSEVDFHYMARPDEIRENARKTLKCYMENEDYIYLVNNRSMVSRTVAENISLIAALGYVSGLAGFIVEDNLVAMRRHERPERYIDFFTQCRKRLEAVISKNHGSIQIYEERSGQLSFM